MDKKKNRNFRATDAEFQEMKQNAQDAGMKLSNYIRFRTMHQKKPTIPELTEKISELYAEQDAQKAIDTFKDELIWYFTEYRDRV